MIQKPLNWLALLALLLGVVSGMLGDSPPAMAIATEAAPDLASQPDALYFWDFEADGGGFNATLDWQWGTYAWVGGGCYGTSHVQPPAAYSGTNMWGTVLNTCYNNLGNNADPCANVNPDDDSILSFAIDLTDVVGDIVLSWWAWYDLFGSWDWAEVRANGDVVWQNCGSWTAPTAWEQQMVDLASYAGGPVTIEFHMMASTVVNYAGWYIDDVMVTGLRLDAMKEAPATAAHGDVIPYTITLSPSNLLPGLFMVDPLPPGVAYAGNLSWKSGEAWYDEVENAVHWAYTGTMTTTEPSIPVPQLAPDAAVNADLAGGPEVAGAPVPEGTPVFQITSGVLWNNGPLVTHPGECAGIDASRLQTDLGMNTLGFGHQLLEGNRMADDFVITDAGWLIDEITFFAYQTNAPVDPSPITGVYYQIWDGPPNDPASSVVFGDLSTNRLVSTVFTNIQRDSVTSPCANNRYIFADVASAGVWLPQGTYWLDWMTDGSLSSGPWAPPITILGQTTTGNALQYTTTSGTWGPANDSGTVTQQGMPFLIQGEEVAIEITFDVTVTGHCGDVIVNEGTAGLGSEVVGFSAKTEVTGVSQIAIEPPELLAEICPDCTVTLPLEICNVGDCPLTWELLEETPTLEPVSIPPSDGNFLRGEGAPSAGRAPIEPLPDGVRITPLSTFLGTRAYATEAVNGFHTLFDLDVPEALPNRGAFVAAGFPGAGEYVNGYVYVADTTNTLYQLDPVTGAVLSSYPITAPPNGESYSGFALDPTLGALYGSSTNVGTSSLLQVDPTTGAATLIGPITGSGCNIAIAIDGTGQMYGYDICTDDFWAIDKSTGAGTLIGSIGFDANFGQGMGWDPATNQVYMAAFNNGTFQPELRIVDLTTGNTAMVGGPIGATSPGGLCQLPWLGMRVYPDFPWISQDPISGTLPRGECQVVEVSFDSTGMAPGEQLFADLLLLSNDPEMPEVLVPTTMTVLTPLDLVDVTYTIDDLEVTFDATATGSEPLTYAWDFDDGTMSDEEDPVHVYDEGGCYTVTLAVENPCSDSNWSEMICVCEPVYGAAFNWSPESPVEGMPIDFSATVGGGTAPFTYTWDFGDGFSDVGMAVSHTYEADGSYLVELVVNNACGSDVVTDTITVEIGTRFIYLPIIRKSR